jgi:glycosyltransferase involved in cell wall biosynthesis
VGSEQRLLAQLDEKNEWIEQLEQSLRECEVRLEQKEARLVALERDVTHTRGSFLPWKLAERLTRLNRGRKTHHSDSDKSIVRTPVLGVEPAPRKRVLIIDHRLPTPDRDCGSLRMVEMIRMIVARGHAVAFIPDNFLVWPPYLGQLQAIGVDVVHPPAYETVAEYLKQHGRDFGLVIISRADVAARHMTTVRRYACGASVVFDTVDLHFLREERQALLGGDAALAPASAARKEQEIRLAIRADLTLVVSPIEKALLEKECPGIDVMVVPTIYQPETSEPPGYEGRRDIVFIGSFDHSPNVDAVLYFATEIFARVRARIPAAVFQVVGPYPTPEISRLDGAGIRILGHVEDVKPVFDQARLSVAPLRFGAGVKGKVNHSMALGVPSVVTSVAAEGMYLVHEQNAMIADDAESFADAVVRVWTSKDLWNRISVNGRRSFAEHFSVQAAAKPIGELLQWAG